MLFRMLAGFVSAHIIAWITGSVFLGVFLGCSVWILLAAWDMYHDGMEREAGRWS